MSQAFESPLSRESVLERVREILAESFELEPSTIRLDSHLIDDLDLDSIDAIDIFTQLRELTGRRPDPADARKVRTVEELIDFVFQEIDRTNAGAPEGPTASAPEGPTDPEKKS